MTTHTEHFYLDSELTLRDRTHSPLTVHAITLSLTQQEDTLRECRLTFHISTEIYQYIETQALFNLKPELRGSLCAGDFLPELDIEIEATLQPDLLPHLTEHTNNIEQVAGELLKLQPETDNPLLLTESWFALHIKQQQESGETGYSTFWTYVNPSIITQDNISSEQISQGMVNFFKDWLDVNLPVINQETISENFEEMTKAFEEWTDSNLSAMEDTISEAIEEVSSAFEEFAESLSETTEDATSNRGIFQEVVNFFTEDDWHYAKIKGEPVLRMAFHGEHGQWNCYAKVRVEQAQFIFYSVCPVNAPEDKRMAITEFLTRANCGMIIGNFELDFADGEIRYKTSIDVKGDLLSFELIKQLVYANVMMMDEYLPGMMSVIYSDVSPKEAIAQIESIPEPPTADSSNEQQLQPNPPPVARNSSPSPAKITAFKTLLSHVPQDLRCHVVQRDDSTETDNTVALHYVVDHQGLLSDISLEVGVEAEVSQLKLQVSRLRMMRRYLTIAAKVRQLRENLSINPPQSGEASVIVLFQEALGAVTQMTRIIEQRFQKLVAGGLEGKEEIEVLVELEQLREQLAKYKGFLASDR